MARALEAVVPPASSMEVGEWVELTARDTITMRTKMVADIESVKRLGGTDLREALAEELRNSRSDMYKLAADSSSRSLAQPAASHRPTWLWIASAALLALAVVSAAVVLRYQRSRAEPAVTPAVPQAVVREVVVASPPQTTPAEAPLTTASASASTAAVVAAPPPRKASGAAAAKRDCEQPYVVDSSGHMHFRKECL